MGFLGTVVTGPGRAVYDQRGCERQLYDAFGDLASSRTADDLQADLKAVRAAVNGSMRAGRGIYVAIMVPLLLALAIAQMAFWHRGLSLLQGAMNALLAGVMVLKWRSMGYADPDVVAGELLRHKRCPSCAYSLRGLKSDGDGVTTCPECGGAWKMHATNGSTSSRP